MSTSRLSTHLIAPIDLLDQAALKQFHGGIQPLEMKSCSNSAPIGRLPLPDRFIIPLQQHLGSPGRLLVTVGQSVGKGEPLTHSDNRLTLPVHAATSGIITAIRPYHDPLGTSTSVPTLCVELQADGHDVWYSRHPLIPYSQQAVTALIDQITAAGIAGLGGAGFPSSAKWSADYDPVQLLIINAAECEPYITADDRLMQEQATEIIQGCQILHYILRPQQLIIAIEANKPQAINALQQAIQRQASELPPILLRTLPTRYPSGGARQLIFILTGREVPQGEHAISLGIVMHNVATVFAIQRAIMAGESLIERVVTLTGEALTTPGNLWVRLGTPIDYLLRHSGFDPNSAAEVLVGGPLMGLPLTDLSAPVIKTTNCLLVRASHSRIAATEQPCIRCGDCATVCPANLLPQQLYWYSRGQQHQQAREHHLFDCIECGACTAVCPSHIPLVQYYQQEKAQLRQLDRQTAQANQAKARFEAKRARLTQQKQARQHALAAAAENSPATLVAAAIARAKARKSLQSAPGSISQLVNQPSSQPGSQPLEHKATLDDPNRP